MERSFLCLFSEWIEQATVAAAIQTMRMGATWEASRMEKKQESILVLWASQRYHISSELLPSNVSFWRKNKLSKSTVFSFFCYKLLDPVLCCTSVHGFYSILFFLLKCLIIKIILKFKQVTGKRGKYKQLCQISAASPLCWVWPKGINSCMETFPLFLKSCSSRIWFLFQVWKKQPKWSSEHFCCVRPLLSRSWALVGRKSVRLLAPYHVCSWWSWAGLTCIASLTMMLLVHTASCGEPW